MALCVAVTVHSEYLQWLADAVDSIEAQTSAFSEKIVAFDGCESVPLPSDWQAISGNWRNPADARNAAMARTKERWIVFWDADNVMAPGYSEAMLNAIAAAGPEIGILYPDLQYVDADLCPRRFSRQAEWSYWPMRLDNCVDTAAAWRRVAIEMAGGWHDRGDVEDFALALELTEQGWQAARAEGATVIMREHSRSRLATSLREGRLGHAFWRSMSLAVVTPSVGRRGSISRWSAFFERDELPDRTTAYVVDDSEDTRWRRRLLTAADRLLANGSVSRVDVARSSSPRSATASRHAHVALLYASVLPRIREDLILTFEDDVVPPSGGALALAEELLDSAEGHHGAVAATYPLRENPRAACAGLGSPTGWGESPLLQTLPGSPIDVAYVGGGFTLWANWAIRRTPISLDIERELGWDAILCERIRQRGFRIRLHGGVRCHHLTGGRKWITEDYPCKTGPYPSSFRRSTKRQTSPMSLPRWRRRRWSRRSSSSTTDRRTILSPSPSKRAREWSLRRAAASAAR